MAADPSRTPAPIMSTHCSRERAAAAFFAITLSGAHGAARRPTTSRSN